MNGSSRGFSIVGLILGIASLIALPAVSLALFLTDELPSLLLALDVIVPIVGIVLSAIGMRRNPAGQPGHGMAVAGLVLNIIAVVGGIILVVLLVVFAAVLISAIAAM